MWPNGFGEWFRVAGDVSVRAVLLAAAVGTLLAVLRLPRGGVRHAAWAAVVVAMLLMPVLTRVVPPIEVPLPAAASSIDPLVDVVRPDWTPRPSSEAAAVPSTPPTDNRSVPSEPGSAIEPRGESRQTAQAGPKWPFVVAGVYAVGVMFFLVRLAVGLILMHRLLRRSQPLSHATFRPSGVVIRESPRVSTPLTVGVVAPVVILPATWPSWTDETLRTAIAHEAAHAQRRDTFVALVAFINRAVFWFHPLAWWLERAVARHAEDACDAVALREATSPRRYAEVLMEMAEAVRHRKGRVAWQGVGVDGAGMLGQRINRILRGDVFKKVSMTRKLVVSLCCVGAIALAVACQQRKAVPAPLQPDPQLTAQWAKEKARTDEYKSLQSMTAAQVADLEAAVAKDPQNRDARRKLLDFYYTADFKHQVVSWKDKLAARRRHLLWAIANDPGGTLIRPPRVINSADDPKGYGQAKKLWLAAMAPKDVALPVLRNAAYFFGFREKELVEQILLRAEATDPGGPTPAAKEGVVQQKWAAWLGSLYASSIVDAMPGIREAAKLPPAVTDADQAFARAARAKLDASSDVTLLVGAGSTFSESVLRRRRSPKDWPETVDLELLRLGKEYLDRAARLDPTKTSARRALAWQASMERSLTYQMKLRNVPKDKQEGVVRAWPEDERLPALAQFARMMRGQAEYQETSKKDMEGAKGLFKSARTAAEDVLKLAESRPNDPARGTYVFAAQLTLGEIALHDNDLAGALKHLDAAGTVTPSDELKYGQPWDWQRFAVQLMKWGERESVARFLDRMAAMSEPDLGSMKKWAGQIRAGVMPPFYQSQALPR